MLQFYVIQTRPLRPTYGAIMGDFTFVITLDDNKKFHATAKCRMLSIPITEIGNFRYFQDAIQACEKFYHSKEN